MVQFFLSATAFKLCVMSGKKGFSSAFPSNPWRTTWFFNTIWVKLNDCRRTIKSNIVIGNHVTLIVKCLDWTPSPVDRNVQDSQEICIESNHPAMCGHFDSSPDMTFHASWQCHIEMSHPLQFHVRSDQEGAASSFFEGNALHMSPKRLRLGAPSAKLWTSLGSLLLIYSKRLGLSWFLVFVCEKITYPIWNIHAFDDFFSFSIKEKLSFAPTRKQSSSLVKITQWKLGGRRSDLTN